MQYSRPDPFPSSFLAGKRRGHTHLNPDQLVTMKVLPAGSWPVRLFDAFNWAIFHLGFQGCSRPDGVRTLKFS